MKAQLPRTGEPLADQTGDMTRSWRNFFTEVQELVNELGSRFKSVVVHSFSGSSYVLDSFAPSHGIGVVYSYAVRSGSANIRSGSIIFHWSQAGTVPDLPAIRDAQEIGDTSDLTFSVDYSGGKVRLLATSTSAYRFTALRLFLV